MDTINSLNIVRTNIGWALIIIKSENGNPEVHQFPTFTEVKQYIQSLQLE